MTADTSAVVAALSAWHEQHHAAAGALEGVTALPAHVMLAAYSVLTRLPGGLAVPAATAAHVLGQRFRGEPLRLPPAQRLALLSTLARAGVLAGSSYDGLVALEAAHHGQTLLTLDRRARDAYRRLGADFTVIAA
ncbi:MAG: PIN domain-containing protein [Solirubrobacteraceae bacterium]